MPGAQAERSEAASKSLRAEFSSAVLIRSLWSCQTLLNAPSARCHSAVRSKVFQILTFPPEPTWCTNVHSKRATCRSSVQR